MSFVNNMAAILNGQITKILAFGVTDVQRETIFGILAHYKLELNEVNVIENSIDISDDKLSGESAQFERQ